MAHTLNAANQAPPWSVALVGNPNCGKTALFNLLTGARQKVANYAGVTVERKIGTARLKNGRTVSVVDLPGAYSLTPATPDEQITLEVIEGRRHGEAAPDAIVAVVDATNLRMNLRLVLELKRLGRPLMIALNMADVARDEGLLIDVEKLSTELGCPVVETVAVRSDGHAGLLALLEAHLGQTLPNGAFVNSQMDAPSSADLQKEVRRIIAIAAPGAISLQRFQHRIDAVVMHPVWGLALLAVVLFLMFQAVFSWANVPMDAIKEGMAGLGDWTTTHMSEGPLRSLLVDGMIAGAGGVLVFLPQILILFFFILLLEDSGYLPRAAFLLDRLMGSVGLSGRSFIPLLSSFACAIPGIMATRTIPNVRDRLATILLAPMMTCSARLPVYALIISAFIPNRSEGPFNLQGLVLFALSLAGVAGAVLVALIMRRATMRSSYHPLLMELPESHWPNLRNLLTGLWERTQIFLTRVGTIILALMVLLWFLASYPQPPAGATGPAIRYSFAGMLGSGLETIFKPLGFNWQISVALVPGLAAREVVVGALGTVYSLAGAGVTGAAGAAGAANVETALRPMIASGWSLATALSLLAWYVFAPQCLSTLVTVRRETNSWRYPLIMTAYLFVIAYVFAFVTYRVALSLGAGG